MKNSLLELIVCPLCKSILGLDGAQYVDDSEIESGTLICPCGKQYPIQNGIPRFVSSDGYVVNFSLEWNRFAMTQLDSFNRTSISLNRFKEVTGLEPEELNKKRVLEVGCGMGRFLEVVAESGAEVVGIDLSYSVDAARSNLKRFSNVHLIQADLFNMPLREDRFDLIYSIGVLHHTPKPKEAFLGLIPLLRENGKVAVWITPRPKISFVPRVTRIVRFFTPRIKPELLLRLIKNFVPLVLPFVRIPFIGRFLKGWLVPICDYKNELPLNREQLLEWSILDTFDLLSPRYLYPYTVQEVKNWFIEANLSDINTASPPVIVRAERLKSRVLCAE